MAFSLNMNTIFLIELLFVLNIHIFPNTISGTPLDDVCNRALDQTFCLNDFGSNPRTKTAGLHSLAQIAISKAILKGAEAESSIQTLMLRATNPQLKAIYVQCLNIYGDTANALQSANIDLSRREYRDISMQAGVVSDTVERCEALFKNPFMSPVTRQTRIMKNLGNILGIIANDLNSRKRGIKVL